ncbi:MAG: hypothetical protein ACUVX1_13475 [Chloroflexota bacterium]
MTVATCTAPIKVKGDIKCYHCGYVSGQLVGESTTPLKSRLFVPSPSYSRPLPRPGEPLTCGRCGGPVYLDDVEVVKERVFRCVVDPYETRPGRRPGKKVKTKTKTVRKTLEKVCA